MPTFSNLNDRKNIGEKSPQATVRGHFNGILLLTIKS